MDQTIRKRDVAMCESTIDRSTEAEAERCGVTELDATLRKNGWGLSFGMLGFIVFLACGLYLFGSGKFSVLESLGASAGLTVSLGIVIVGAWTRPASLVKHRSRRIVLFVILAACGGAIGAFITEPTAFVETMAKKGPLVIFATATLGLLMALLATGLAMLRQREKVAIEASIRAESAARLREEQLAHRVVDARLAALQAQVEPHFLFNTLGAITELAEPSSPAAAELCRQLVDFLRGSLGALRAGTTTLGTDIDIATAYLQVMATRLGRRMSWSIDVSEPLREVALPPAMTISLVENAIKHGIEPWPEAATIAISARVDREGLVLVVEDTGRGLVDAEDGTGFGLANIRARLRLQYGDRASLELSPNRPRGTRAMLRVPIEVSKETAAEGAKQGSTNPSTNAGAGS